MTTDELYERCPFMREDYVTAEKLYYYTDLEALLNGICQDEYICLWATRITHLNDKEELNIGLNTLTKGKGKWKVELVRSGRIIENLLTKYIISFSKKKDSLPMWSMYGRNGEGVMLTFDRCELSFSGKSSGKSLGVSLRECQYAGTKEDKEIKKAMVDIKASLKSQNSISIDPDLKCLFLIIENYPYLLKHPSFMYEQEVRVAIDSRGEQAKFRNRKGAITPYIEVCIPKKALKEVWLGPNRDMKLSMQTLKEFLDSRGYNNVVVKASKVPYRG